jgi:hypothetical protein
MLQLESKVVGWRSILVFGWKEEMKEGPRINATCDDESSKRANSHPQIKQEVW